MSKLLCSISSLASIGAALWYLTHNRVDLAIYFSIWVLINQQWLIHEREVKDV